MSKRHYHNTGNTRTKSRATAHLNTFASSKKVLTFSADSGNNVMDEIIAPIETQRLQAESPYPYEEYAEQSQAVAQNSLDNPTELAEINPPIEADSVSNQYTIKPAQPITNPHSTHTNKATNHTQFMQLYQSDWSVQPYPHAPLSEGYYHYLTTPPPVAPDKSRKLNYAGATSWGPIPTTENKWLGWAVAGVGVIIALILIIILLQPDTTVSSAGVVTAVAPTATVRPTPTPLPAPVISAVADNEKWGMITADNGYVRNQPRDDAKLNQTLGRNTLVAFEKKSNDGWYMLAGGGWLRSDEIKTFPNQQAAQTAITLAKANVTVSVGASSTGLPVPSNDSQLSPQQLSAAGLLTFPAPACNIKGELNSSGAKTYYLPNQQAYAGLSMLPAETHRWFCTEQDAIKNGFNKSNSAANAPTPTPAVVTTLASPFTLPQTATPKPFGY